MTHIDNPQFGAPGERQKVFHEKLMGLARQIREAGAGRVVGMVGAERITFDHARRTYFELRPLITTDYDALAARGYLRMFPPEERPLLVTTATAQVFRNRYDLPPEAFGTEAIDALRDIATGRNPGRIGFREEDVPVVDVVNTLRENFDVDTARDVVIAAVTARQRLLGAAPGVDFQQNVNALTEAVVELPSFEGPEVAESLMGAVEFASRYGTATLFRRAAASLRNFALLPDNVALLVGERAYIEELVAHLPQTVGGRRSLEEVLTRIPVPQGGESVSRDPEAVGRRLGSFQAGLVRGGRSDAVVDLERTRDFGVEDQGTEVFPRRRPDHPPSDS